MSLVVTKVQIYFTIIIALKACNHFLKMLGCNPWSFSDYVLFLLSLPLSLLHIAAMVSWCCDLIAYVHIHLKHMRNHVKKYQTIYSIWYTYTRAREMESQQLCPSKIENKQCSLFCWITGGWQFKMYLPGGVPQLCVLVYTFFTTGWSSSRYLP